MGRVYTPFAPRAIRGDGAEVVNGTTLKRYRVVYGEPAVYEAARFAPAAALVAAALPSPDVAAGRPGAGFVIHHQGLTGDDVVLGWWDRENELPVRVWVRDEAGWRPARDGESFCVWDLEIVWHEREAWVATGMSGLAVNDAVAAYSTRMWRADV